MKERESMQNNINRTKHSTLALFYLLVLASLVLLAACGGSSDTGSSSSSSATGTTPVATGSTQTVMIITDSSGGFAFSPKTLTVKVGTMVVWKNTTQTPQTVTSDDRKSFNSGDSTPVNSNMTFSHTFTAAGTFAYHCDFHTTMKATIVVQ